MSNIFFDACKNGDVAKLRSILQKGEISNIDIEDSDGVCGLLHASLENRKEIVHTLVNYNSNINRKLSRGELKGVTALMASVINKSVDVFKLLISYGHCDVDCRFTYSHTHSLTYFFEFLLLY